MNPKVSKKKEIIDWSRNQGKREYKGNGKNKSIKLNCFFLKTDKNGNSLARLVKKKREKTQIVKLRNERGDITTNVNFFPSTSFDHSFPFFFLFLVAT